MKRRLKLSIIFGLIFLAVGAGVGIAIAFATGEGGIGEMIKSPYVIVCAIVGLLIGVGMGVFSGKPRNDHNNMGTDSQGEETEVNFDSRKLTPDEMKNDKELIFSTWRNLPNLKKSGFVFRNKQVGPNFEINMKPETHALVLGTTGTGKTQVLANPTIRILAHTGEKPSLVMTDPKGELYNDNAAILKEEGYDIIVLNLNDPYASSMWNPMEIAYKTYEKAGNLVKEVKKYTNVKPEDVGCKKFDSAQINGAEYGDVWYGFENKAFPNEELLHQELESRRIQLEDEAKSDIRNIALSLIPDDPNSKDPTWSNGCRDFITGIMYAMLEDSRDPRLGMTLDKFNFFNLYKICMKRDPAGERESALKTVTMYADGRDKVRGNVYQLMSGVCLASGVTQRSFLSTLSSSIGKTLGDEGILFLTSGTDIDFTQIPERPTAFFIRIPDHKTERHPLGVLCISQLYKVLVDVANKTVNSKGKTGTLKRPVYFILDEFGNMPAVPNFGTMVTVARSRRIFLEIILQSYKQLDIKYGENEAKNIRGNFQMEVFLGSEDATTIQEFSEACGETTVFHEEVSRSRQTNKDIAQGGENITTSVQRTRKPLIDKQELRQLPRWTVIAKIFRKAIMQDVMTPFYETKCMAKKSAQEPLSLSRQLNIDEIFYDIEKRNAIVLKNGGGQY